MFEDRLKPQMQLAREVLAAFQNSDVRELKRLRKSGFSLDLYDLYGRNLLHMAIAFKKIRVFEYLMTLDEIPKNEVDPAMSHPLMYALTYSTTNPVFASKLIQAGCEIPAVFSDGDSTLHWAARLHWPDIVELLVERGADIDYKNKRSNETAIHVAAKEGYIDIVWMLLFYGADPNIASTYSSLTVFDLVCTDEASLNKMSNFRKTFGLKTFVGAMEKGTDFFDKLMDAVNRLHYDFETLKLLAIKFHCLPSQKFKIFVNQFGYIVQKIFGTSALVELVFQCPPTKLQNFCENFFILFESDIISTVVRGLNKAGLLTLLIRNFDKSNEEQVGLLTKVLCGFLSYGVNLTPRMMNAVYSQLGYCDLFKTLLHIDIPERLRRRLPRDAWPAIIYDVRMDTGHVTNFIRRDEDRTGDLADEKKDLSVLFTVPSLDNRVPSLAELTRNASRRYIIDQYQIKNSMQFYTRLKNLPIAEQQKKMISFERRLYRPKVKDSS